VGTDANKLMAFGVEGIYLGDYTTADNVQSSPAIGADGTLYFGCNDNMLYALAPDGLAWSYDCGGNLIASPAIGSDGNVHTGSSSDGLFSISSSGQLSWSYFAAASVDSSPAIGSDGKLCVGSSDNTLYVFKDPTPTPTVTPTPVIDLTPDKTTFAPPDRIVVTANVWPISIPCYPFVRVLMADGRTLYYERGRGFINSPTPYLGFERGPLTVASSILGYPVLSAGFSGIAVGTYYLEGGAVDATQTTSASNLVYIGTVDREALVVQ
jgi:hypothetical protein